MHGQELNRYIINLIKSVKRYFLFNNRDRIVSNKVCKLVMDRLKSNIPDVAARAGILALSTVPRGVGIVALRNEKFKMKYISVILIDDIVYDAYNDIFGVRLDEYIKKYSSKLVINTKYTKCEFSEAALNIFKEASIITDIEYYSDYTDSEEADTEAAEDTKNEELDGIEAKTSDESNESSDGVRVELATNLGV